MRRVLALLAAIAMVVGAVVARRAIDGTATASTERREPLRVVCSPELAQICTRLAGPAVTVRTEAPLTTLARLSDVPAAEVDTDLWAAPGPWDELLAAERERRGRPALPAVVALDGAVALSSPLVVVDKPDRAAVLRVPCDGGRCLAEMAGDAWSDYGGQSTWGTVKVGLPDPLATGTGLVALGTVAAGFFDDPATLASSDLDASLELAGALRTLAADVTRRPDLTAPVAAMAVNPAAYDIVVAVGADTSVLTTPDRRARFRVRCAAGAVDVGLALTAFTDDASDVAARLVEELRRAGWQQRTEARTGPCARPPGANSPIAPVLLLRVAELWRQAR